MHTNTTSTAGHCTAGGGNADGEVAGWVEPEWAAADLRPEVRALITLPPGPALITALEALGTPPCCPADHSHPDPARETADPTPAPGTTPGYPCCCQLIIAAAWEAATTWTALRANQALTAAAGTQPVTATPRRFALGTITDPARTELAPLLRISPDSVAARLHTARTLAANPNLTDLIADGLIFGSAQRAILAETSTLTDAARSRIIDELVTRIRTRRTNGKASPTAGDLARATRDLKLRYAADETEQARAEAFANRRVTIKPDTNNMAYLGAAITHTDAHRINNRLNAAAHATRTDNPTDTRTIDQLRADLLVQALLGTTPVNPDTNEDNTAEDNTDSPAGPRPAPAPLPAGPADINVTIDLATLLGAANNPAHIPGIGPVPPATARALAADARWRLWITHTTNNLVTATSPHTYTPTTALARLIRARETTCRTPGCNHQATTADLDHTTPWPTGTTTPANLGPLCRRCHNLKTHHNYQLTTNPTTTQDPDPDPNNTPPESWTWTYPSGLTHTRHPEPPLLE